MDSGHQVGVKLSNGNNTLTHQEGTAAAAKLKLKDLFGWAAAKGWPESEVMAMPFMESAWINAFWMGENGNYNSPAPAHAWNIHVPNGGYNITYPLPVSYTHLRAHETVLDLVCRLLLEKQKKTKTQKKKKKNNNTYY